MTLTRPLANHAVAFLCALLAVTTILGTSCRRDRDLIDDNAEIYRLAREAIAERKFLEATRLLGDIGLVTPVADDLAPKVKLALADAYFYQPGTVNVVEAQSRYEQFLAFYPLDASAPYARLQVGACLLRQAESPENDQEFSKRAADHFKAMIAGLDEGNPWRRAAGELLARAQERLSEHEWIVASYYLKQEKWRGAASRLETMVRDFPSATRREDAFYELARARLALGELDRARDAIDLLLREYPGGARVEAARQLRRSVESAPSAGGTAQPSGSEVAAEGS